MGSSPTPQALLPGEAGSCCPDGPVASALLLPPADASVRRLLTSESRLNPLKSHHVPPVLPNGAP